MADWGLYSALRGVDNWSQKRADEQMQTKALMEIATMAQQDLRAQQEAEAGMAELYDAINKFDFLPEDMERVRQEERMARTNLIKGITKFNGDINAYMAAGGISDLKKYQSDIINSEAVQNAKWNKQIYANYIEAQKDDKFIGKAVVEVPKTDKDGKIIMKDGKPVTDPKRLSFQEQMALYQQGVLPKLNLGKIEDKVNVDQEFFKKYMRDAKNPLGPNYVTTSDFYKQAISQGASQEQAVALTQQYAKNLNENNAWKWGAGDPYDIALKQAKAMRYAQGSGSSKTRTVDNITALTQTLQPSVLSVNNPNIKVAYPGAEMMDMLSNEIDWTKAYSPHYDDLTSEQKQQGIGQLDFDNIINKQMLGIVKRIENGQEKFYAKARIDVEDDGRTFWFDGKNQDQLDAMPNKGRDAFKEREVEINGEQKDVLTGEVFYDITPQIMDPLYRTWLTKQMNIKDTQDNLAPYTALYDPGSNILGSAYGKVFNQLAQEYQEGLLSEEEYNEQKQQLLLSVNNVTY